MMRRTVCVWALVSTLISAALTSPPSAAPAETPLTSPPPVPLEDYPLYDLVVDEKFLTPETKLVLLERPTLTRLHPEQLGDRKSVV